MCLLARTRDYWLDVRYQPSQNSLCGGRQDTARIARSARPGYRLHLLASSGRWTASQRTLGDAAPANIAFTQSQKPAVRPASSSRPRLPLSSQVPTSPTARIPDFDDYDWCGSPFRPGLRPRAITENPQAQRFLRRWPGTENYGAICRVVRRRLLQPEAHRAELPDEKTSHGRVDDGFRDCSVRALS